MSNSSNFNFAFSLGLSDETQCANNIPDVYYITKKDYLITRNRYTIITQQ